MWRCAVKTTATCVLHFSILNKITPERFDKLGLELLNVGITSQIVLKGIILLVGGGTVQCCDHATWFKTKVLWWSVSCSPFQIFEKALDEPKYSPLYAQLCHRLCEDAPNFEPPNSTISVSVRAWWTAYIAPLFEQNRDEDKAKLIVVVCRPSGACCWTSAKMSLKTAPRPLKVSRALTLKLQRCDPVRQCFCLNSAPVSVVNSCSSGQERWPTQCWGGGAICHGQTQDAWQHQVRWWAWQAGDAAWGHPASLHQAAPGEEEEGCCAGHVRGLGVPVSDHDHSWQTPWPRQS